MDPNDPQSKKLLEDMLALAQENNRILHYIKRDIRIGRAMRIIYWGFIILSFFGAYFFIQPYLGNLLNIYGGGDPLKSLGQ